MHTPQEIINRENDDIFVPVYDKNTAADLSFMRVDDPQEGDNETRLVRFGDVGFSNFSMNGNSDSSRDKENNNNDSGDTFALDDEQYQLL